jgi:5-methylcytosine-specific restriction endonuclease McrA
MTHKCCTPECAQEYARIEREKKDRKETRTKLTALKTRSEWLKEAQVEFNRYIRERDRDLPCISCGRFHGGSYDAGHYRSVGAAPHLRFNEDNCWRQCVPCNQHKAGNAIEYRIHLVERIGTERVSSLESDNSVRKWSIDDAKRIKAEYRDKFKELQRERNL